MKPSARLTAAPGAGAFLALLVATTAAEAPRALVRHAPSLNGTVDGSVQQLRAESVALNGGANLTGDLFVPGLPAIRLNGNPRYGGTTEGTGSAFPSNYQVTLSGNAALRHVVRRTDAVALPILTVPPAPTGTRRVALSHAGQSPGDFSSLRDLSLDGNVGQLAVPVGIYGDVTLHGNSGITLGVAGATQPAVYAFQRLTIDGTAQLQVVGPVIVTTVVAALATNGVIGSPAQPSWLTLNVCSGDVTLNGDGTMHGNLNAPNSQVTINGNARLVGGLACDRFVLNGSGVLRLVAPPENRPPQISLADPANGAVFLAPASVTLAAMATDPDGSVARVEFFQGPTKLGESTIAPYRLPLTALAAGSYTFTARATDHLGASSISTAVSITVVGNQAPMISLTAPPHGATFTAPASLTLQATASDSDGVVTRVEFFRGTTKIGEDLFAPYEAALSGLAAGSHIFTARAFDGLGAAADSAPITIIVQAPNQPPSVELVAPLSGVTFAAPASLTLVATASDPDGSIARIEFYQGATRLGNDIAAPYEFAVSGLTEGSYTFSARAYDNLSAATTSASRSVTVTKPNQAPTVALLAPAEGTVFMVPATILLAATASDADGAVTKVEFFQGTAKLGESASAPFEFTWPNVPPGAYSLTARAHDNAGASTTSAARNVTVRIGLPYFTSFEVTDGYALGPLAGQNDWSSDAPVRVSDVAPYRGERSLVIAPSMPPARATHTFPPVAGQSVAFVDFLVRPAAGGEPSTSLVAQTEAARIAFVQSDAAGALYVFNGNGVGAGVGTWDPVDLAIPLTAAGDSVDWLRLTLREDYAAKRWDLYVNAQLVATDLGFIDDATSGFTQFQLIGHASAASAADDFFAGFENPLFVDADKDGMEDAWESRNGLDPTTNDRTRDADGDGVTAIGEYRAGTSPTDFFNGVQPQVEPMNGGGPGPDDELAMRILKPNGMPWPNAPATFDITSGDRRISGTRGGPNFTMRIETRTDENGVAQVYLEALNP